MAIDWPAVANARLQAHCALQWPARAARANLPEVADDSHASLTWDESLRAPMSAPLPGGLRVGLRISTLELISTRGAGTDVFALAGKTDADASAWIDSALREGGLEPAGMITLPYEVERASYAAVDEAACAELSGWFAAASAALEALRSQLVDLQPGAGPVYLWPHHFDIATLVRLEKGDPEFARSVGVGLSPGDGHYAQPYAYVSPWPSPDAATLPPAPRGGHWHTQDFVAAVATADELLAVGEKRAALLAFAQEAFGVVQGVLNR